MDQAECGAGCLFALGLIVVGIAVGHIYSAAAGWLVIGGGLVLIGVLGSLGRRA